MKNFQLSLNTELIPKIKKKKKRHEFIKNTALLKKSKIRVLELSIINLKVILPNIKYLILPNII